MNFCEFNIDMKNRRKTIAKLNLVPFAWKQAVVDIQMIDVL